MKKLLLLAAVAVLSFGVQSVQAKTITFGDSTIYWDGWASTDPGKNVIDALYTPLVSGGAITLDDASYALSTVSFFATGPISGQNPYQGLSAGDLFINSSASDNTWDYVVHSFGGFNSNTYKLYDISSLNITTTAPAVLPGKTYPNYGTAGSYLTSYYRDNQPIALTDVTLTNLTPIFESVDFSGLGYSTTYDFTDSGLTFTRDFVIAWSQNCGNDVIYEQIPVPEPSTIFLLGAGLLGIGIAARRKTRI